MDNYIVLDLLLSMTMNQRSSFLSSLLPFIFLGIGIALCVIMLILLAYVVVWGLLIAIVLWLAFIIKNKFFPAKPRKRGITIDHKDIK